MDRALTAIFFSCFIVSSLGYAGELDVSTSIRTVPNSGGGYSCEFNVTNNTCKMIVCQFPGVAGIHILPHDHGGILMPDSCDVTGTPAWSCSVDTNFVDHFGMIPKNCEEDKPKDMANKDTMECYNSDNPSHNDICRQRKKHLKYGPICQNAYTICQNHHSPHDCLEDTKEGKSEEICQQLPYMSKDFIWYY